jgi:hypothetical protein
MWIRKTEEELKNEERIKSNSKFKISHQGPFAVFLGTFICLLITDITGEDRLPPSEKPMSISEIFYNLPHTLLFCSIMAGLVYLWQYYNRENIFDKEESPTVICDKCNISKTQDGNNNCKCGGEYISIKEMKWIEDDSN